MGNSRGVVIPLSQSYTNRDGETVYTVQPVRSAGFDIPESAIIRRESPNAKGKQAMTNTMDATSYAQGVRDATAGFASKMSELVRHASPDEQRSTPGTWHAFGRFSQRAAEHIVMDGSFAATPHGVFNAPDVLNDEITRAFVQAWTNDAMPSRRFAVIVEQQGAGGVQIPVMTDPPTADAQPGEKLEAYSSAFTVETNPDAVSINATLYLNVSGVLDTFGGMSVVQGIMRAAVASTANAQIVQAMTQYATDATDLAGAFASFDGGRYVPSVVVVPPSALFTINANELAAAGITIVVDPSATVPLVVDPNATLAVMNSMSLQAAEPSAFGYAVAFGAFGKVGVDAIGVAKVAGP